MLTWAYIDRDSRPGIPEHISIVLKGLSRCLSALWNVFQNAYSLCKTSSRWTGQNQQVTHVPWASKIKCFDGRSPAGVTGVTDSSSCAFLKWEIHPIHGFAVDRLFCLEIFVLKLKELMKTGNLKTEGFFLLPFSLGQLTRWKARPWDGLAHV